MEPDQGVARIRSEIAVNLQSGTRSEPVVESSSDLAAKRGARIVSVPLPRLEGGLVCWSHAQAILQSPLFRVENERADLVSRYNVRCLLL